MPQSPKAKQNCPLCHLPMSWFGDHWVCVNIKMHDNARNPTMKRGKVLPFRKKKKK